MASAAALQRILRRLAVTTAAVGAGVCVPQAHFVRSDSPVSRPDGNQPRGTRLRQDVVPVHTSKEAALLSPTVAAIVAVGGTTIIALLLLSMRSTARTERTQEFIAAVEKLVNSSPAVRTAVGGVGMYAAGSYKLALSNTSATGFISLSAPGKLHAAVDVEAQREHRSKPWQFTSAVVNIDKQLLEARNEERAKFALESGYGPAAEAIRNAVGTALAHATTSSSVNAEGKEVITFKLA